MVQAVPINSIGITMTDLSGTIATGGSSQLLSAAKQFRRGFYVFNSSAGDLWINDMGNAASAGGSSIKIPAGALYENPVNGVTVTAIYIFGASTGQSFSAKEW
jgi:hypothetical protein